MELPKYADPDYLMMSFLIGTAVFLGFAAIVAVNVILSLGPVTLKRKLLFAISLPILFAYTLGAIVYYITPAPEESKAYSSMVEEFETHYGVTLLSSNLKAIDGKKAFYLSGAWEEVAFEDDEDGTLYRDAFVRSEKVDSGPREMSYTLLFSEDDSSGGFIEWEPSSEE